MKESIEDAREELKRVDHLIFVSLKYTRTVDVLLNVIKRMIDAYDFAIEGILRYAQEKKMIEDDVIPGNPLSKADLVLKIFHDPIIKENMELYLLFRKIVKADYERFNEYRRHVTLKTIIDNKDIEIKIDNVTEYYAIIKEFVKYIDNLINEVEE
jgi:hypothetical protein